MLRALVYAPVVLLVTLATGVPAHAAPPRPQRASGGVDASVMPRTRSPAVVGEQAARGSKKKGPGQATSSWTDAILTPVFVDRRRRVPRTAVPAPFGAKLVPGEKFRFDVSFAGNPAGLAEASVVRVESDRRGPGPAGAPRLRIEGRAQTSGVVSLLATVTDEITSILDARTGAPIQSINRLDYDGFAPKYKHRLTDQRYEGRGSVRIVDTKDEKVKRKLKRVPVDTFDPMSAMAWVRNVPLERGGKFKAHVVDGTTLMRIEVEPHGPGVPQNVPSIAQALELGKGDIVELRGKLTRVDEYDQPIPGKKAYEFRAWVSNDARRIPLVMESDMWVGAIRLQLNAYDPPPAPDGPPPATAPASEN